MHLIYPGEHFITMFFATKRTILGMQNAGKNCNHLNQEFDVSRPNEVWVSDVTYFKYGKSAYYICVIIDLFSRMVIAYKIG